MIEFKILKKSKKSNARLGILKASHGEVETPAFVPVATQAAVKMLTAESVKKTKTQILICNTFHLHLKPGERVVKNHGGLHKFMNWKKPLMTDSGGFQVFSLGFGKDFGINKIVKSKTKGIIKKGQQPKLLKITNDGVFFTSYLDGRKLFLGPKESIKIQEALEADIIFAFDECPPPFAEHAYLKNSLKRTHAWAKTCLNVKKSKQALYGIVQGGRYRDLRIESAKFIGSLPFNGFGIGGEFGNKKRDMILMLKWMNKELPENKPRHLLGIGHPDDILSVVKSGIDTFDCTLPTHYARHGIAFTSEGRLDMTKSIFLSSSIVEKKSLDKNCDCLVCNNYSRGYITHLLRAHEATGPEFLTFHNLFFFNNRLEKIRLDIAKGKI
ncbi:MAG: tRNA guanosine(34) transglycosylase Tgt [Patescibacteria group bacterium]|nr:tRNA guanosine(34) transglycosylase Tgt [Patescibacteria group bacterium]